MDRTDAFLATTLPRLRQADTALHNGDAGPRMAMWSHDHPVTLFGGAMGGAGWEEIEPIFRRLGAVVLRLSLVRLRGDRSGRQRRPRLHGRLRAHHGLRTRRPTLRVRAACHHRVPPRARRVEGGAPSRRSGWITERRRRPPETRSRDSRAVRVGPVTAPAASHTATSAASFVRGLAPAVLVGGAFALTTIANTLFHVASLLASVSASLALANAREAPYAGHGRGDGSSSDLVAVVRSRHCGVGQ